ncbi:helix-turn-helix domain-containing protein [Streptomyces filamentosus]|uniref:helix-turn-helix domain-containing protein n=1 Tax=Streptomyces filamentosus TaxID=67294 RepID=UPI0033D6A060
MLLTTSQAAAELGCAVTTYRRLIQAGLLPGLERRGNRIMTPLQAVQALSTRSHAPLHQLNVPEIAVLRVNAAQPPHTHDSEGTGFHTGLPAQVLLDTLRGWWRCDAASVAAGQVLPVTVSGYVVAVLTGLEPWQRNNEGRCTFSDARLAGYVTDLITPRFTYTSRADGDRSIANHLLGTRLPSDSGGPFAYVPTRTPDLTEAS